MVRYLYFGKESGYYWYLRLHETTGYVYAKEAKWKGRMIYVGTIWQVPRIARMFNLLHVKKALMEIYNDLKRRVDEFMEAVDFLNEVIVAISSRNWERISRRWRFDNEDAFLEKIEKSWIIIMERVVGTRRKGT